MRCFAKFCNYTASAPLKRNLFCFQKKDRLLRRAWLTFCEMDPETVIPDSARLCCAHFKPADMDVKNNIVKLKKETIPTIRTYEDSDPNFEMEIAASQLQEDCGLGEYVLNF